MRIIHAGFWHLIALVLLVGFPFIAPVLMTWDVGVFVSRRAYRAWSFRKFWLPRWAFRLTIPNDEDRIGWMDWHNRSWA